MKKDRINTSSIREIKHSFKRFLSLLVMSVLGVLVFVGLNPPPFFICPILKIAYESISSTFSNSSDLNA